MVNSRRGKKSNPPKVYTVPSTQGDQSIREVGPSADMPSPTDVEDVAVEPVEFKSMYTAWKVETGAFDDYAGYRHGTDLHELSFKHLATAKEVARIFEAYGRAKLEEVVAKASTTEAEQILRSKRDPLKRLNRLVQVMRYYELPAYDFLSSETCAVVQAVQYCKLPCLIL
jgi:hypothetical protein